MAYLGIVGAASRVAVLTATAPFIPTDLLVLTALTGVFNTYGGYVYVG
jgi:hypothetical protein